MMGARGVALGLNLTGGLNDLNRLGTIGNQRLAAMKKRKVSISPHFIAHKSVFERCMSELYGFLACAAIAQRWVLWKNGWLVSNQYGKMRLQVGLWIALHHAVKWMRVHGIAHVSKLRFPAAVLKLPSLHHLAK